MAEILPDAAEINELRDNVLKYQGEIIDENDLAYLAQSISSKSIMQDEVKKLNISANISDYEFESNFNSLMEKLKKREEQKYETKNKKIEEKDRLLLQEKRKRLSSIKERLEEISDAVDQFVNRKKKAKNFIKAKCRRNLFISLVLLFFSSLTVILINKYQIANFSYTLYGVLVSALIGLLTATGFFKKFFKEEAENNHYLKISYEKFNCCPTRKDKLLEKKKKLEEELKELEQELLKAS